MKITKIEDLNNIPEGITELDISCLGLTTLPKLPQSLTKLYCGYNQLTSLDLPQSLTYLQCSHNKLTTLYNLQQGLTYLDCSYNKLTILDIENCNNLKNFDYNNNNFPEEMQTILKDKDLSIQEKINKLIDGCLIPYDNSFVLK